LEAIKAAIQYGFENHLGIRLETGGLTAQERELFERKLDRYRSWQWIDRVKPRFQKREAVQSAYKAEAGMVRFTLVVNLAQRRLKDIYITGDFLSFPSRALYDLESALRGMPLDRHRLIAAIAEFFEQGRITVPGMALKDFIIPLEQALEKIKITQFGIPLEHCNQISVTNGSFKEIMQKSPSVLLLPYCAKLVDCDLRYAKGCKICGQAACSIGPAWQMGRKHKMRVISITSYEDLWAQLMHMKRQGVEAFIGCCCQPFYAKHADDFRRSKMPGILLDIDNTTCYDLDQARQAYAGTFESQTALNLDLLETVLNASTAVTMSREASQ
jgi:lipoate-protein ligase A